MKKIVLAAAGLLASLSLAFSPASAANLTVKDGAGTTQYICAVSQSDASLAECHVLVDTTGTKIDPATKQLQQALITLLGAAPAQVGGKIDTVMVGTSTDIGASVPATTATTLAAANSSRRGFALQNQTTGNCWLNGIAAPTGTYHDLLIAAGAYYDSSPTHVGTGTLQIYCAVAGSVYGRQW